MRIDTPLNQNERDEATLEVASLVSKLDLPNLRVLKRAIDRAINTKEGNNPKRNVDTTTT
tara:strand:- start:257 stop:436 length:180 start_codon:yes stop_codon:yes gene_type:complete